MTTFNIKRLCCWYKVPSYSERSSISIPCVLLIYTYQLQEWTVQSHHPRNVIKMAREISNNCNTETS